MNETDPRNQLDLLRQVERLTEEVNKTVSERGRPVFGRYPLTVALLALFGVIMLSEGVKGILKNLGILEGSPWHLFLIGLAVLIFTGTLYKKLDQIKADGEPE